MCNQTGNHSAKYLGELEGGLGLLSEPELSLFVLIHQQTQEPQSLDEGGDQAEGSVGLVLFQPGCLEPHTCPPPRTGLES